MEGIRRGSFLLVACIAWAELASAGTGIQGISTRRQANLTSVAIQAIVSGDDDSTAVLRLFQKWRENPAYDTGMVLVRRPGSSIHEGRILWMTPGRTAYWYIEGRDGASRVTTPAQLARVEPVPVPIRTGPLFYVDQRTGDDRWNGIRPTRGPGSDGPTRTINAALRLLAASPLAGRGGGVFVAPGEYHERLTLDFGADGDHHFIAGDGTNRDSTILCGANPWVEQGLWAPGRPLSWSPRGDSIWSTPFPAGTAGSSPGDSTQLVVLGWGEYLHRKTSLRALLQDSTGTGDQASINDGERSGWFWQRDSLYVKRASGRSPLGVKLHTGYLDALIDVQRRNWNLSNLTLRFAGGRTGDPAHAANPAPSLSGHGIVAGVTGVASGLVVNSCRFYGLNADAIYVVHGALGQRADSVTIAHCTFDGLTIGAMTYGAGKARAEERAGQVTLLSRAANFYANTITGTFNGLAIGPGDPAAGPRDSTWGSQNEIAYNTFRGISDDGIELDTSHLINTLLLGNRIEHCGHGISQTPAYTGPLFAFYNTVVNTQGGGLKLGGGNTAVSWYVNNTFTASNAGGWAIDAAPGGAVDHVHFRNNILAARGNGYGYTIWGPAQAGRRTNDFDYDLLDSVGTTRLVLWNGQPYSFPQLQTQLGWELHGTLAAPQFVDSAGKNWGLTPTSPGSGRGQRITGVNTSLDGPRYQGTPDIGAQSLSPLAGVPQPAQPALRLSARGTPNPMRADGVLEFVLPVAAEVEAQLYDLAGRRVRTLLEPARFDAGVHRLRLLGPALPPGVYLYRVRAGGEHVQGKLVLLR